MTTSLSHKEALSQAKNLSVPEQITRSLAQVFQHAQSSYVGHRKHLVVMRTIQQRAFDLGFEDAFNISFCRLVNKVLPIKKAEQVADRIAKLVVNFISSIQDDEPTKEGEQEDEEEEEDTVGSRFIKYFIHHLLRGVESKDKNVRYRVMHLLSLVVNSIGEIDNELYNVLIWEVHKRLFDKEPNVRLKAVLCLTRFQEEDVDLSDENSAIAKLLFVIQNDSSAEVRRAALLNLDKNEITLPYLMERAKDVNSINRKLVYSRIVREIGDFRLLDRKMREKILTWGLKDRENLVQQAAIKMFCSQWYENCNSDLMELLERLHLIKSEIAETAMKFFFEQRPQMVHKIQFEDEFWRKLNVEASFLAKMFYNYCIANDLNEMIEKNFPVTTEFAGLLTKYLKVRKATVSEDTENIDDINFVIEQLLSIAKNYDFGDEVGRREMLQTLRMSLYDDLTDSQVEIALKVLKKISINEKDFCQLVSEIIIDIRDEDEEFSMDMEMDFETTDAEEVASNKLKVNRALQILSICQHMLELTHEPLRGNIPVTSLLDSVINPAIRSKVSAIREGGVKCLGLCCLLDDMLATEQLAFFGICCAKGNGDLHSLCLKIIFDILSVHGPKVLDVEGCVDSLSMHKLLFRSLKKYEIPVVQAITAEGLCKLYLNDVFNDEELFETLLLAYFHPQNSTNEDLIQALSFCLPVYAFSHPRHQEKVAKVAADSFSRLFKTFEELQEAEDSAGLSMTSPSVIIQQLIHWTDSYNIVNCSDATKELLKYHLIFVMDLLDTMLKSDNKLYCKTVAMNLSKFIISETLTKEDLDNLYDKAVQAKDEVETNVEGIDKASINALNKFISSIAEVLAIIEEIEKDKPKENNEEFVKALTEPSEEEKKQEKGEEDLLEAIAGEANEDDLAIPETSLMKLPSNQSIIIREYDDDDDEDEEEGDFDNGDILVSKVENTDDDEVLQSANNSASTIKGSKLDADIDNSPTGSRRRISGATTKNDTKLGSKKDEKDVNNDGEEDSDEEEYDEDIDHSSIMQVDTTNNSSDYSDEDEDLSLD